MEYWELLIFVRKVSGFNCVYMYVYCRERALEAKVDQSAETALNDEARDLAAADNSGAVVTSSNNSTAAAAASIESVKGGEMLMSALDLVQTELPNFPETEDETRGRGRAPARNPLLLGLTPYAYMMRSLRSVKAPDLEHAVLVLPFHYVCRLIGVLIQV